jgi:hypothetical protein
MLFRARYQFVEVRSTESPWRVDDVSQRQAGLVQPSDLSSLHHVQAIRLYPKERQAYDLIAEDATMSGKSDYHV